jgi:hypothetical protein
LNPLECLDDLARLLEEVDAFMIPSADPDGQDRTSLSSAKFNGNDPRHILYKERKGAVRKAEQELTHATR